MHNTSTISTCTTHAGAAAVAPRHPVHRGHPTKAHKAPLQQKANATISTLMHMHPTPSCPILHSLCVNCPLPPFPPPAHTLAKSAFCHHGRRSSAGRHVQHSSHHLLGAADLAARLCCHQQFDQIATRIRQLPWAPADIQLDRRTNSLMDHVLGAR